VAAFDFDAARCWARLDPEETLERRDDGELPFVNPALIGEQGLLLDACVYIDQMWAEAPKTRVDALDG
jgi:hypothetical protein